MSGKKALLSRNFHQKGIPIPFSFNSLKLTLFCLFLALFLGIAGQVLASEMFESYGTISGGESGQSIYGTNWLSQTFSTSTSHYISFVKLALKNYIGGDNGKTIFVSLRNVDENTGYATGSDLIIGSINASDVPIGEFPNEYSWVEIYFNNSFQIEANKTYTFVVRCPECVGYITWSATGLGGTYPRGQGFFSTNSGVNWYNLNADFWFQDWGNRSSYMLFIAPTTPQDCVFTTTTTPITFSALGLVYVADSDLNHYSQFDVIAQNWNTGETIYFSTSTSLEAGAIYPYEIPVTLSNGAWKIFYRITGYNLETRNVIALFHKCEGTGVGTELPIPQFPTIPAYEIPTDEDCSTYPLLEKLVCEIRNTIKNIFLPSPEKLNQLNDTFSVFTQKMPFNYIIAIKNFLSDVKSSLNTEQNLTFTILGNTSNVSFAFWDKETEIAGETQSFSEIFRVIFTIILMLAFLMWGLNFGRKIFK